MKKISKVLSVFLALLMAFAAIPMTGIVAMAADDTAVASTETYSIKYNANGGSGSMSNSTHNVDEEQALTANSFNRTGYVFLGWARTKTATEAEFVDKQVVVNLAAEGETLVTLYAVWSPITYSVEFRANGGQGTMANQEFKYGVTQALSENTFTREGYTFRGWAKSGTATKVAYVDKKEVKNLATAEGATVVLYALWEKNPVTVTSIYLVSAPTNTEYFVGDTFDATGLAIGINLSDNTTKTITTGFEVAAPDMATAGEQTVTVTYEGYTVTFTITVVEKPVYNYTFSINAPAATEIANGESVVLSTKLEGTYPDGMYVVWSANNANFAATQNADGTYTVVAEGAGATTFTAKLYTAEGELAAEETVELTALEEVEEPGFFAKIINFFKNIINAILGIFKK